MYINIFSYVYIYIYIYVYMYIFIYIGLYTNIVHSSAVWEAILLMKCSVFAMLEAFFQAQILIFKVFVLYKIKVYTLAIYI